MVFSSLTFLLYFFPAVILIHYFLPRRAQNPFLLLASLLFYAWGDMRRVPLFLGLLIADWGLGLLIGRSGKRGTRRLWLTLGLLRELSLRLLGKLCLRLLYELSLRLPGKLCLGIYLLRKLLIIAVHLFS